MSFNSQESGIAALSAVCDCGISESYSLTIFNIKFRYYFVKIKYSTTNRFIVL